jgi:hypothetical protein
VLHQLSQHLLRLRHLLLLISEPRLLHGRQRVLGVLRRGVSCLLSRLVRVVLLPWLHKSLMREWLLRRAVLRLAVRRLGLLLLAVWSFSIQLLQGENAERVAVYKALPDGAYGEIEVLGEAVSKGLALPLLATAKMRLWLEDPSLNLGDMGWKDVAVRRVGLRLWGGGRELCPGRLLHVLRLRRRLGREN